MGRGRFLLLLCLALCSSIACGGSPSVTPEPEVTREERREASPPTADQRLEEHARELLDRARELQPSVTALLVRFAHDADGEMVGLEHRIKSLESTLRKMRLLISEDPSLTPETVMIQDALRYTMLVDDDPPGNYVQTSATTLDALEAEGHRVLVVKNYWPDGDNYAGVNAVLEAPDGLPWELQFHTTESYEVQEDTRAWYEELRLRDTPPERKRELFDLMTEAWDEVSIPSGVLEPHNLHENEEIRDRPRP